MSQQTNKQNVTKADLQKIFQRDLLLREFLEIAKTAGYIVTSDWDKDNRCPKLEKMH